MEPGTPIDTAQMKTQKKDLPSLGAKEVPFKLPMGVLPVNLVSQGETAILLVVQCVVDARVASTARLRAPLFRRYVCYAHLESSHQLVLLRAHQLPQARSQTFLAQINQSIARQEDFFQGLLKQRITHVHLLSSKCRSIMQMMRVMKRL